MLPRVALPPSNAVLALIAALLVLPGLVGHDPWRPLDLLGIETAHEMLRTGDWLQTRVAGEAWPAALPLYYWVAAVFGKALGWLLTFHGAARLAGGFLFAFALWSLYHAARAWAVEEDRRIFPASAALVFIGSIGLIVRVHEATPDMAGLAAICAAIAAVAQGTRRATGLRGALAWGAAFGAALGAALLSVGPIAPVAVALGVAAALAVCEPLRTRKCAAFFALAMALVLLVCGIWLLALDARAPGLAAQWGAQVFQSQGGVIANARQFIVVVSWFAWPAWPLAAWALWSLRDRWREPRLFLPLAITFAVLCAAARYGANWEFGPFVLLAPLALLAAQAIARLPRSAASALDWFAVMTFTLFAALVWLGYLAMIAGFPAAMARNFARLAPGFKAPFELLPFLLAVLLVPLWIALMLRTPPAPSRAITRWTAGVAMLWATFAALWMPWVDYQKTYTPVALQIKARIPAGADCLVERNLGRVPRAALHYHAQVLTTPFDRSHPEACPLLLVQGSPALEPDLPGKGWRKLADVGRAGDKFERFRLYRLEP